MKWNENIICSISFWSLNKSQIFKEEGREGGRELKKTTGLRMWHKWQSKDKGLVRVPHHTVSTQCGPHNSYKSLHLHNPNGEKNWVLKEKQHKWWDHYTFLLMPKLYNYISDVNSLQNTISSDFINLVRSSVKLIHYSIKTERCDIQTCQSGFKKKKSSNAKWKTIFYSLF